MGACLPACTLQLVIERSTVFRGNWVNGSTSTTGLVALGGAVAFYGNELQVSDSGFVGNTVTARARSGSTSEAYGGALYLACTTSYPRRIANVSFTANRAVFSSTAAFPGTSGIGGAAIGG